MTANRADGMVAVIVSEPSPSLEFLYSAMGGETITAMVKAFYRPVPGDDLLGPMYPAEDLEGSEKRLRDFLIMRLGGPQTYMEERGHPRLRMRHAPFVIGDAERDRWLQLMEEAMLEAGVKDSHAAVLLPFFRQVADFMRNR